MAEFLIAIPLGVIMFVMMYAFLRGLCIVVDWLLYKLDS